MSTTARHPGIRKVTTKAGEIRYRLIIDMGRKPDGSRDQRCETFTKLGDAKARQAKIIDGRKTGTLVKPTKITLAKAIDAYLASRRNLRPASVRSYTDSLALVKSRLGHVQVQALTTDHLDGLVTDLLANGRRIGNVQRQGLSPRSINLMLTLLAAVLDRCIAESLVARNVARMVERPKQTPREKRAWTADQIGVLLQAVESDRLAACWLITANGLRRGEVCGLTWDDVDLEARTLTIRRTRGPVGSVVLEGPPKSAKSARTLPLDPAWSPLSSRSRTFRTSSG